ncbi:galactokinase [Stigmatella sp. ncwal1]|uniref:Galactokinase n=1 Tax=Stigmatella ashevillensis TaxID=2995309 RepID=A0ABT5D224_9BACT|nr:galactokinase [Stigmatella ashevillena]MDC0707708.1 galactokinase [Stigmatella ashevillena]
MTSSFQDLYGHLPETVVQAPGRVNLIGEHTDYNGGFVLPMAIPQQTHIELRKRQDQRVRAFSLNTDHRGEILEYELGHEDRRKGWLDYLQGVTYVLRRAGHSLTGFEVRITSEVPLGSGLSSSASLDVSLLRALRQAFSLPLDDVQIALLGQQVEVDFVGAPVGVMDPMAASIAGVGVALFLDTRDLRFERVPLPPGVDPIVINSGVAHNHSAGDYRVRRAECERAAELLGVKQLRDLTEADLPRAEKLPDPLGRRVRHIVTENARVLATVEALRTGDLPKLGTLFYASHDSQRLDYEVSVPEIDLLVDLGRADPDVYGARLTGGGFGGSVVMLAREGTGVAVAARIAKRYADQSGQRPAILLPQASSGTLSSR